MLVHRFASRTAKQLRCFQRPWGLNQPCASFSSSLKVHDSSDEDEPTTPLAKTKDAFGGSSYQWEDPLRLRSQLNDEEVAVWDAARAFCDGELMPGIVEANRHEIPCDKDMMKKMGRLRVTCILEMSMFSWSSLPAHQHA